jgi:glutamate dehydrogenase/leucine dehydrogenase
VQVRPLPDLDDTCLTGSAPAGRTAGPGLRDRAYVTGPAEARAGGHNAGMTVAIGGTGHMGAGLGQALRADGARMVATADPDITPEEIVRG